MSLFRLSLKHCSGSKIGGNLVVNPLLAAISGWRRNIVDIGQRPYTRGLACWGGSPSAPSLVLFGGRGRREFVVTSRRRMSSDGVESVPASKPSPNSKEPKSFYDLAPIDNKGKPFSFEQLRGKVVLIVNVASQCGFTKQYKDLESLYREYKDRGFVVLGFPCNQFGGQEPGNDDEIASFCTVNFGVSFPILHKIDVNGVNADPVYKWLKSKRSGFLGFSGIKWNFEKFLVDSHGNVIERWASTTSPFSLKGEIEKLLPSSDDA